MVVREVHGERDVADVTQQLAERRLRLHELGQRRAGQELDAVVDRASLGSGVEDPGDRGVREPPHDLDLALEAGDAARGLALRRAHLERDPPALVVDGLVDDAHPAATELLHEPVGTQFDRARRWGESPRVLSSDARCSQPALRGSEPGRSRPSRSSAAPSESTS